ncbi:MAG: Crp/Fnr family transcriptional regulator [Deltaproteobacteria bacterium]|nr:Crp/Fnr family transcriptional regulator [Deltaproteobacteria bacterium]MBW2041521.1 Crp/Fnr family transcriptional regulator [Deltaproteobacteria bacterium]MBW2131589.1 Crp/Fnr family transcriptional regulator [Deltaproteobacteria bacterium]
MTPAKDALAHSSLFEGLPREQMEAIRRIAVSRQAQKGEIIFSQGDPGNGFYIVDDGVVKVFTVSGEGKEQILHILGGGEPFGEVAAFTGRTFPAHAEALTDCRLWFFPKNAFVQLVQGHSTLSLNMIALLCARLHQFAAQVESLSLKAVPSRLATYLMVLAEEQEATDSVVLKISKGQLASLLGTIPETLSRVLARLSDQGLIQVEGKSIRLKDVEGLLELSEQ